MTYTKRKNIRQKIREAQHQLLWPDRKQATIKVREKLRLKIHMELDLGIVTDLFHEVMIKIYDDMLSTQYPHEK